ncbi:11398_t:CDS:2 [Ambispora gerdemannii]|uniref:11398_t:CDS:1 n=1 Tax=Ambispora gerdemannii TaxID=144530 RepID=A0A9N8V8X6_9GLOM|nr:11398_t:CDS:2 [Ambispora gerdemannii]
MSAETTPLLFEVNRIIDSIRPVLNEFSNGSANRLSFTLSHFGKKPYVIGHRGASDTYPENTILAFEKAIDDGADAIEFDIRKTLDDKVVVLHDSRLERTTTGIGKIAKANYHSDLEHVTTKRAPHCRLPLFDDVVDMLLKEQHRQVWGVIDIKPGNPLNIFELLAEILRTRNSDLGVFSKRIMLGIWHPKFLPYARKALPDIPIVNISESLTISREFFSDVDGYSMSACTLAGKDGQSFLKDVHDAGKPVFVWTINAKSYAKDCYDWGVDAIITDKPKYFIEYFQGNELMSTNNYWWFSSFFRFLRILYYKLDSRITDYKTRRWLLKYGPLEKTENKIDG